MNKLSSFLYARPSFIEGVARLIDLGNTLQEYNSSLSPEQADALAIFSDWRVVGEDLASAMLMYEGYEEQITDDLMREAEESLSLVCDE